MKTVELIAEKRVPATKGALRTLRVGGRIPAVVYGGQKEPNAVSLDQKAFFAALKGHGTNVLVNLKVGSDGEVALVKDVQRDVLTHDVINVDFQRVSMTETIEVNVPLHVVGEAPGVKLGGGILEHILRDLRVRCLPGDIPEAINIDVSALQINQNVKVKDLALPKGVETGVEAEQLVINIVAPTELEEATPAAAAPGAPTSAEPEVIAKGKKPEDGEAAAAPAKGAAAPAKDAKAPAAKK
jgi:large subunit ribosomal protein L25